MEAVKLILAVCVGIGVLFFVASNPGLWLLGILFVLACIGVWISDNGNNDSILLGVGSGLTALVTGFWLLLRWFEAMNESGLP